MKDQKDLKELMPTDKAELTNWLKVKDVTDLKDAKQEIERLLKCVLLECGCLGGVKCGGEG